MVPREQGRLLRLLLLLLLLQEQGLLHQLLLRRGLLHPLRVHAGGRAGEAGEARRSAAGWSPAIIRVRRGAKPQREDEGKKTQKEKKKERK